MTHMAAGMDDVASHVMRHCGETGKAAFDALATELYAYEGRVGSHLIVRVANWDSSGNIIEIQDPTASLTAEALQIKVFRGTNSDNVSQAEGWSISVFNKAPGVVQAFVTAIIPPSALALSSAAFGGRFSEPDSE